MSGNPITDEILNELLDNVENSLEDLLLDNQRNGDWKGFQIMLENQFDIRLDNLISGKGGNIHRISKEQNDLIIRRKTNTLVHLEEIFRNQH